MNEPRTFDDIQVARPELAASYLQLLRAQPGRPIALFARRRVGKTHFLDYDLTPAAREAGMLPVYADVWLHRTAPLLAIVHALEEALDDVAVPGTRTGKVAKTTVKGLAVLGSSLQFGDEPSRRPLPETPELRLDALVPRLATAAGKPVLLMLDEIQALGESETGKASIATLRAVFQKHKKVLFGIFTGSSQEALSAMIVGAGAPMYQFAQMIDFPYLDETYLQLLARHFSKVHPGKHLDMQQMAITFDHISCKPALMKDIVKAMSAEGVTDFQFGLNAFIRDEGRAAGWRSLWNSLDEVQQLTLVALVCKLAPMSKDTLARMNQARAGSSTVTIAKVRTALTNLRKAGILMRIGTEFIVEDTLFADHIINMKPFSGLPVAPYTVKPGNKS
ncbi:MAG TPA: hypothetical protein VK832_16130 [Burkholderiaceae bacterium]|jgi:hypothetical protein|nr:hypothetical protein [Burkholderiaceae bacterium]